MDDTGRAPIVIKRPIIRTFNGTENLPRTHCQHGSQPDGYVAVGYTFGEYETDAINNRTALYPQDRQNMIYPALALCGEAGEVAEKVKKLWRNHGKTSARDYTEEEREGVVGELGDVLWYIGACARELGISLELIALANSLKVRDRAARGVVKSEGDAR